MFLKTTWHPYPDAPGFAFSLISFDAQDCQCMRCRYQGPLPHSHLRPQVPITFPVDQMMFAVDTERASQLWLAESFIPLIFVLMTGGAKKDKGTTSWPPPKLPPLLVKIKSAAAARISCFEQSACQLSGSLQDPSKIKFLMRLTSDICLHF